MHKPWHQRSMMKYNVGGPVSNTRKKRGWVPANPNIQTKEVITVDDQGRPLFLIPSTSGGHAGRRKELINREKIEGILSNLPEIIRKHPHANRAPIIKTDYGPLGILGLNVKDGLINMIGNNNQRDRAVAEYLQENPDRYTAIMERFDGDINKLSKYLSSDEVTEEDIELFNPELTENLEIASGTTENPDESGATTVSTEEEEEQTDDNTEPTPEEPKEETVEDFVNRMSTESFIDRSPEYRPEAKRAGNVAQMYGEIAPGQVGGFGPGLSRGARTAELRQQGIEDKEREYEKERAIEMAKLAAEPAYGDFGEIKLGQLGNEPLTLQVRKSKYPGRGQADLAVPGSADAIVNQVYNGISNIASRIKTTNDLLQSADDATGGPAYLKSVADKLAAAIGYSPKLGEFDRTTSVVNFLQLELAKELLGEGGKTISDNERQMIKDALGEPGVFKSPALLKSKLQQVLKRLNRSLDEHERFLSLNSTKFPSINEAVINYEKNAGLSNNNENSNTNQNTEVLKKNPDGTYG